MSRGGHRLPAIVAKLSQKGAIVNPDLKATLDRAGLQALFEVLKARGYRLVGPRISRRGYRGD
jgi:hypothetical protein